MATSLAHMIAPPLLVITISMLMVGIMLSQVSYYVSKYQRDPRWMKWIVYTVCVVEVAHAGTLLHMQYFYVVEAVQNQSPKIIWSSGVSIILGVITTGLVQGLYIYRIWQFGQNLLATSLLSVLLLSRSALSIATVAFVFIYDDIVVLINTSAAIITINAALSVSVVIDILSPAMFVYSLKLQETQVKQTQTLMRKLAFYTVNTGAIAIVFSAATLFTFNLDKNDFLFTGFVSALGQVYANTMMALLNARQRLRNSHSGGAHSIPLESEGYHNLECVAMPSFVIEISPGNEGNTATHDSAGDKKTGTSSSTPPHYTLV